MSAFTTPEWESNAATDKTCSQLFNKGSKSKSSTNQIKKKKKNKKTKKPEIKTGRVEKPKSNKQRKKLKSNVGDLKNNDSIKQVDWKKNFKTKDSHGSETNRNDLNTKKRNKKANENQNKNAKKDVELDKNNLKNKKRKKKTNDFSTLNNDDTENKQVKKQKPKLTHQTLFCQTSRKTKRKKLPQQTEYDTSSIENTISKKKMKRLKKKLQKLDQNENLEKTNEGDAPNKKIKKHKQSEVQNSLTANTITKNADKYKEKLKSVLQTQKKKLTVAVLSKKQKAALPLRERMLEKLKAGRFRYLNEQMYTTMGRDAKKYFESDPVAYSAYHEGYQQQVSRWPVNPLDIIIEKIKKLPRTHVIADFGCGEAKLAKSVPHMVHSFDLVAANECVIACDMAHVPLEDSSVNVVVFCLSLMGTNLKDYLVEANRVLKVGGLLKIAEVESRFDNVADFIKSVQNFGFVKIRMDLSHNLFCFLDFVKKETKNVKQKKRLPDVNLNPCLYKKR